MINQNWEKLKEDPPSVNNTWFALNSLSTTLQAWGRESFGSVKKEIKKLEKELDSLRRNNMANGYSREEKELEKKLYEMFEGEEVMAKQRSRIDWLREGDRNTSFFHARASARRRTNKIKCLRRVDGSLCEDPEDIRSMVHDFYSNMFTSEPCDSLELVLKAIPRKVTEDMNEDLCKEYTNEEIRTALFKMGPTKAPGPDGFLALFYQIHWDVLGEDICAAVKDFLLGRDIPEGFCDSQKEASGLLKGIRNGRNGPPISHLLFADDSVFFTKGDDRSTNALKSALQSYCKGSGQRINLQKSSIFFGLHCDVQIKEFVKQTLGVQDETLQTTYLGMPTWVGRSPTGSFNFLPGRMWKRLNGCSDRPLSRAGKEVLLKSVAQAIPTYVMSCFQIPLSICEKMRQPISNFWWGIEDGKKKLHWRSWDWLSSPKYIGGLGFRDMAIFNLAMLGKQCWRLLTEPNSLCAQVFKGRYYPNGDFWTAQCPRSSSYVWRSFMHGKKLIQKGILWRVGNGKGSSSKQDYLEKAWKRLWAIQCPNKMKIVLWRIAHNCLPTGSQLQTRRIPTRQWLLDWIVKATPCEAMIMAVAMWHIWENRNNYRNGEVLVNPLRVVGKIKAYIEFITVHNVSSTDSNRRETPTSTQKWSPPLEGWLLINVDAAVFSHSGRAGYGVVVRDHRGTLLSAYRGSYIDQIQNPEVAEAIAVRQALIAAEDAGFQKIQVVSDCLSLMNKVQDRSLDRSPSGAT